jgi:hypothetical protein
MDIARGLCGLGWRITLLRCKQANEQELAPVINAFPGTVITAPFNGPYPAFFNRRGLRRLYAEAAKLLGAALHDDAAGDLARRLLLFARKCPEIPRPDVVWGITVGFLSGPLSAQYLAAHYRCPFVVEFQDPVPHPGRPRLVPEKEALMRSCLSEASLVVTTTNGISRKVESDFPVTNGKVRTHYLTYDENVPREPCSRAPGSPLVLIHAGVLYGGTGRNATTLIQAIAKAVTLEPKLRHQIKLRLIGGARGAEEAAAIAVDSGIPWAVEVLPQIPLRACLAEMDKADVLVVIKFDDAEYDLQVPGKIFQYLGRGKPILGLMRETEAAGILRHSGLATIHANSDVAGIAATLVELWRHRDSLANRFTPCWDYIKQFSVSASALALERDLRAAVNKS